MLTKQAVLNDLKKIIAIETAELQKMTPDDIQENFGNLVDVIRWSKKSLSLDAIKDVIITLNKQKDVEITEEKLQESLEKIDSAIAQTASLKKEAIIDNLMSLMERYIEITDADMVELQEDEIEFVLRHPEKFDLGKNEIDSFQHKLKRLKASLNFEADRTKADIEFLVDSITESIEQHEKDQGKKLTKKEKEFIIDDEIEGHVYESYKGDESVDMDELNKKYKKEVKKYILKASLKKEAYDTEEMEEELNDIIDEDIENGREPQEIANHLLDIPNENLRNYTDNFIGNEFDLRQYIEERMEDKEIESSLKKEAKTISIEELKKGIVDAVKNEFKDKKFTVGVSNILENENYHTPLEALIEANICVAPKGNYKDATEQEIKDADKLMNTVIDYEREIGYSHISSNKVILKEKASLKKKADKGEYYLSKGYDIFEDDDGNTIYFDSYEEAKQYMADNELIGWSITREGFPSEASLKKKAYLKSPYDKMSSEELESILVNFIGKHEPVENLEIIHEFGSEIENMLYDLEGKNILEKQVEYSKEQFGGRREEEYWWSVIASLKKKADRDKYYLSKGSEIYEDDDGNTIYFNSHEEAEEYIVDNELKGWEVTRGDFSPEANLNLEIKTGSIDELKTIEASIRKQSPTASDIEVGRKMREIIATAQGKTTDKQILARLRTAEISNMFPEFDKTGGVWQVEEKNGKKIITRPDIKAIEEAVINKGHNRKINDIVLYDEGGDNGKIFEVQIKEVLDGGKYKVKAFQTDREYIATEDMLLDEDKIEQMS